jgi:hypothetical protein
MQTGPSFVFLFLFKKTLLNLELITRNKIGRTGLSGSEEKKKLK